MQELYAVFILLKFCSSIDFLKLEIRAGEKSEC
jgi:hypothetical protein